MAPRELTEEHLFSDYRDPAPRGGASFARLRVTPELHVEVALGCENRNFGSATRWKPAN
jgi:hypothetical protein